MASAEAAAGSVQLLRELLTTYQTELHLSGELLIPESQRQQAYQQIYPAVDGIASRQRLESGANLPILDDLLNAESQRYVLVTAVRGFTRMEGNYGGQLAKTIGVGILTMGMMVPVSVKAKSDICMFIYDRQQKQIVYFNQTPQNAEQEPLSKTAVENQLRKLLAKDFPLVGKQ